MTLPQSYPLWSPCICAKESAICQHTVVVREQAAEATYAVPYKRGGEITAGYKAVNSTVARQLLAGNCRATAVQFVQNTVTRQLRGSCRKQPCSCAAIAVPVQLPWLRAPGQLHGGCRAVAGQLQGPGNCHSCPHSGAVARQLLGSCQAVARICNCNSCPPLGGSCYAVARQLLGVVTATVACLQGQLRGSC